MTRWIPAAKPKLCFHVITIITILIIKWVSSVLWLKLPKCVNCFLKQKCFYFFLNEYF